MDSSTTVPVLIAQTKCSRRLAVGVLAAGSLTLGVGLSRIGETSAEGDNALSTDEMREMARRFYEDYHKGNLDAGPELVLPSAVFHLPLGDVGTVESDRIISDLTTGFEDFEWTVEDSLVDGDRVATRWIMSGTHTGPFSGIPPTGEQISLTGMTILRFEEGKIAEGWIEDDMLGFLQQLGVMPEA